MNRLSALLVLLVAISPPMLSAGASAQEGPAVEGPDALGFIRKTGEAYQDFHWVASRWEESWWALRERREITFTDTIGVVSRPMVLTPRLEAEVRVWVQYRVSEPYAEGASLAPYPLLPLGYFVSVDAGHAPYLEIESPWSDAEWTEILAEQSADFASDLASIRIWQATLDSFSSLMFLVRVGPRPPDRGPHQQVLGLISEDAGHVSLLPFRCSDHPPCRPYALIRREGRHFVLVGTPSNGFVPTVELVELVGDGAKRVEFLHD